MLLLPKGFTHLSSLLTLFVGFANADLISDLRVPGFQVLAPTDAGYTNAITIYNTRFSVKPAAVAFPRNTQDISTIIKIGVQHKVPVVAKSGGHSYVANSLGGKDGALVVDLSLLDTVKVDPITKIATIGPGSRLGGLALALNDHGRAMPHGTCPFVGIGGHSGHGGFGFAARQWGLTLDVIKSLEVVLANGTILTASSASHPDLFWALRGASSSFGIVSSINAHTFSTPPSVTTALYQWDMSVAQATNAFLSFQSFGQSPSTPAELGIRYFIAKGSAIGKITFQLKVAYYGPHSRYNSVVNPLLTNLPSPVSTDVTERTWIGSVESIGELGPGTLNTTGHVDPQQFSFYGKSIMTPQSSPINKKAVGTLMNYLGVTVFNLTTVMWGIEVDLYGGPTSVINKVPFDATSFAGRDKLFLMQLGSISVVPPPFPADGFNVVQGMLDSIVKNSPPGWDYGAYVNYIDDRLPNWQHLYYSSHYPRLKSLKSKYDPGNVFRFTESVEEVF